MIETAPVVELTTDEVRDLVSGLETYRALYMICSDRGNNESSTTGMCAASCSIYRTNRRRGWSST